LKLSKLSKKPRRNRLIKKKLKGYKLLLIKREKRQRSQRNIDKIKRRKWPDSNKKRQQRPKEWNRRLRLKDREKNKNVLKKKNLRPNVSSRNAYRQNRKKLSASSKNVWNLKDRKLRDK